MILSQFDYYMSNAEYSVCVDKTQPSEAESLHRITSGSLRMNFGINEAIFHVW